jgi:methionyl aminopeptidase
MVYYKTLEEIELIRKSSLLVGKTLAEVARELAPGVTTEKLDKIAEAFILDNGGVPAFKGYEGFPATLCISCNAEVVHGIPGKYELREGDLISVDCGVLMNDFYGDSAYTFGVGQVSAEVQKLMKVTKESLLRAIEFAKPGQRLGDISYAVQIHAEQNGFSVVRELVGHGIGRNLHESPEVPNYGGRGRGMLLKEGLVLAVEPMINMGRKEVKKSKDNWTIITSDGKPSAHYEHTIAITKNGVDVLSSFDFVEQVLGTK